MLFMMSNWDNWAPKMCQKAVVVIYGIDLKRLLLVLGSA